MALKSPVSPAIATVLILGTILVFLFIGWGPGSQFQGLRSVGQWLELNKPSYLALQSQEPELKEVTIFAYTGGNGMIGVLIQRPIPEKAELLLYRFLMQSKPTRPFYFDNISR
jgi:hypothetical protein